MKKTLFFVSLLVFPCILNAGTDTLPDIAGAPTLVPATSAQYNAVTNALQGHQVMRDTDGDVADNTYDLGRPASGRPRDIHLGRNLYVDGQQIDFSAISLNQTGITSGAAKDSGYPQFLQPGGAGNDYCTVSATATDMIGTIDGAAFTLETNINSDDLALAPGSGNVCYVYDSDITGDPAWSKTIGEYGFYISITMAGNAILADAGKVETYKITNGSETELFVAMTDTANSKLIPILRGLGGTDRIAFSYGDTITAMQQHFIFLDDDLATIDSSTTYPMRSGTAPTSPGTGDYWYDSDNKTWKRWSGASWETFGRIYLGMAICDSSDCLWTEPTDFNLAWNSTITQISFTASGTGLYSAALSTVAGIQASDVFKINVAGEWVEHNAIDLGNVLVENIEDGYSESASTWYYFYMSSDGNIYASPVAPRKYDIRLGRYHSTEYWRCFGCAYNNAASNLIASYFDPGTGNASQTYTSAQTTHNLTYSGNTKTAICVPPIADEVDIAIEQTTANAATKLYIRTLGDVAHLGNISSQYIPSNITIRQIGGSLIKLQENTGAYTIVIYPTSYHVDW